MALRHLFRLVLLAILLAGAAMACGGDSDGRPRPEPSSATVSPPLSTPPSFPFSTPSPATPRPIPAGIHSFDGNTPLPDIAPDTAIYLSLGDSLQYGCCWDPQLSSHPLLAHYLSQRLNRPVVWVSLAGNDTLVEFINGVAGQTPQLDRAVELLDQFKGEGRDVVAITLSIGGNDLLALRAEMGCTGGGEPKCVQAFQHLLERYPEQMQLVYSRLNAAKDAATPILQNNYYDAMDCGRPGDEISTSAIAVQVFNGSIDGVVRRYGAFLRDFFTAFKSKACEYISGVDPTYAGYDAIFQVDSRLYESLPPGYVEPFVRR